MDLGLSSAPRRRRGRDDRIILHFDYDCFYASVFENEQPALRTQPLGVKQKSILATCNYVARARGVNKLMLVSEARKICPDLVLVNGEDLTRFRHASKRLWTFLRSHSWNNRVERLGLDEVFLDVTDIVAYNETLLNPHALRQSFFQLSPHDPEKGFSLDASVVSGCTFRAEHPGAAVPAGPLYTRLMLASHLASYLRRGLEEDFGYTSTCGISTNKTLAKLAGRMNKPKNQTTLLSLCDDDVQNFMRRWPLRSIPGLGSRASHLIQEYVRAGSAQKARRDAGVSSNNITTQEVLEHPGLSAEALDRIVGGPGTERGIGTRVWGLVHGVDDAEVKEACDVPSQISVEDTYVARPLNTPAELMAELHALACALVQRLRTDLLLDGGGAAPAAPRWRAYPRTLRLATRVKARAVAAAADGAPAFHHRSSRSAPLPRFVFNHPDAAERLAERLVREAVVPLFRRLHGERQGWNLALLNLGATNMVLTGSEDGAAAAGGCRDIAVMFRTQDAKLKEFTAYNEPAAPRADTTTASATPADGLGDEYVDDAGDERADDSGDEHADGPGVEPVVWRAGASAWEDDEDHDSSPRCPMCGQPIPAFAMNAHRRFHALGE